LVPAFLGGLVGDHFASVSLAIGLGAVFELALFRGGQCPPSLANDLAQLLEIILLFVLGGILVLVFVAC